MKSLAFDSIIFDIDNVLIDTRRSYLEAIRWTVDIYLTHSNIPFFRATRKSAEPQILSARDISQFKLLGGFNDDWDCCYGLLIYLLNRSVKKRTVENLKRAINLKTLARELSQRPLRVSGIVQKFGTMKSVTIERISRIFQEVYLGEKLFPMTEKRKCLYWKKRGLIEREKLIFKKTMLEKLKALGLKLGIATGRPRFEAIYALKRFDLLELFDAVTTMNEVKKAEREAMQSLRKPHPFSLLETAKNLGSALRCAYIGDLPDDVLAATRAKATIPISSIAFPSYTYDPKATRAAIEKLKPDFMIERPSELFQILRSRAPVNSESPA